MIRVVRLPDGALVVGRTAPGRGAWLCAESSSCLDLAVRRHGFNRAFKTEVAPAAAQDLATQLTVAWERSEPDVRG
jgi:predicted RNA-binding protein YlxR (DUF448 family)